MSAEFVSVEKFGPFPDDVKYDPPEGTNNVVLCTSNGTPSHFKASEFDNPQRLLMVHPTVIDALEYLRALLCEWAQEEICIKITNAVRTNEDMQRLARIYGWIGETRPDGRPGQVARDSKHKMNYGGIAVDIYAYQKDGGGYVPQNILGRHARKCFDWVKDDYGDGHVHCDNREHGKQLTQTLANRGSASVAPKTTETQTTPKQN